MNVATESPAPPTVPHASSAFRSDVQGLRALAVLAVVAAHAVIPGFLGGYVGVDVFFVISGFLITGLLVHDIERAGRVRFLNFYARRARRILPAAAIVLSATALASTVVLGVLQARSELTDTLWAAFFAANIHFILVGTDYFATNLGTSPIQHFWSLAVEEQFYLVWPAVIALIAVVVRSRRRHVVPRVALAVTAALITVVSLYLSIVQTAANPTSAYFSTLDRAWELGLGALCALAAPALSRLPGAVRSVLGWAGLAAITLACVTFTAHTAIPGYKALLPVLGSASILVAGLGRSRFAVGRLLSLRPLRFVGDVSYSLYLWHFPVLILGAAYFGARDTLAVRLGLVAASVVLSGLSYYVVENPMRNLRALAQRTWRGLLLWPVATGLVVGTAVLAVPGSTYAAATTPPPSVPAVQAVATAVAAAQAGLPVPTRTSPSLLDVTNAHVALGNCDAYNGAGWHLCQLGVASGTKSVVLFGNSHGAMWSPAVQYAARQAGWRYYPLVHEACGFEVMIDRGNHWGPNNICSVWYRQALVDLKRLRPSVLVLGTYTGDPNWAPSETAILKAFAPYVGEEIVLGDTTKIPNPAGCLLKSGATQGSCLWPVSATRAANTTLASQVAARTGAQFVDVTPWFCDTQLCPSLINDIVPFTDGSHLTAPYSTYLGPAMAQALDLRGGVVVAPTSVPVPPAPTTTTTAP